MKASGGNEDESLIGILDDPKGGFWFCNLEVSGLLSNNKQLGLICFTFFCSAFSCAPELGHVHYHLSGDSGASDQAALESNIPLSPQWLYVKPSETKMVSSLINTKENDYRIAALLLT